MRRRGSHQGRMQSQMQNSRAAVPSDLAIDLRLRRLNGKSDRLCALSGTHTHMWPSGTGLIHLRDVE